MNIQVIDANKDRLWKFELTEDEVAVLFIEFMCVVDSDFNKERLKALLTVDEEQDPLVKVGFMVFRKKHPFFAAILDERRRLDGCGDKDDFYPPMDE